MKIRSLLIAIVLAGVAASVATAGIFRWTDADGRVVYSDAPPKQGNAKAVQVEVNIAPRSPAAAPTEPKAAVAGDKVKLYTAAWCGYCKRARAYLRSRKIPFEDLDVETTARGRREYAEINGNGVPVIFVGGQRLDGYNQATLQRMLSVAGW